MAKTSKCRTCGARLIWVKVKSDGSECQVCPKCTMPEEQEWIANSDTNSVWPPPVKEGM